MRQLLRRAWHVIRLRRWQDDLADELECHRQLLQADLEARGLAPPEAEARSRRQLGNALLARDRSRDVWVWPWLQDVSQDLRFGARMLVKERRFTAAAVFALALGIGVNLAVFRVINMALLVDMPFDRADRLMRVRTADPRGFEVGVSYHDVMAWRREATSFQALAADTGGTVNISDGGLPAERLSGSYVSHDLFRTLGVAPVLGRDFVADDDRAGATAVAILNHDVWQTRYGGDASVVGRAVRLNEVPAIIVGVMPAGFGFPLLVDVWQPLSSLESLAASPRTARTLGVVGRLRDGVEPAQARAELEGLSRQVGQDLPEDQRLPVVARTMKEDRARGASRFLFTLLGAVSVVLLIACANVANLLLARAANRSREMAVRASLGAPRWRLVRQLLIECGLIAVCAGVAGLFVSAAGAQAMAAAFDAVDLAAPDKARTPYWVDLSMNGLSWAFLGGVCLLASVAAGLVPALQVSRTNPNAVLKEGGRTGADALRARRWMSALMVAELTLTLVLLTSAGLLTRRFVALYFADTVIDTSGVVTMRLALPARKYESADRRLAFVQRLDSRLVAVPVFSAATVASDIPIQSMGRGSRPLVVEGHAADPDAQPAMVSVVNVGPRYFETLGLRAVRGRALTDADSLAGREGAVVSERLAAMFFPDADPLGQRIQLRPSGPAPGAAPRWLAIVGVVPNLPNFFPDRPSDPVVYAPFATDLTPPRAVSVIVRSESKAAAAEALRAEVAALDADLPLYAIQTLDEAVARSRMRERTIGGWFSVLAAIAVVLASVGLYALTALGVAQRTHEIGVRMALGATAAQVTGLFIRRTLWQLVAGLALGLAGGIAFGGLLGNLVPGISPRDPLTLLAVAGLLTVVALAASIVPANRAARVDPVDVLREG